MKKNTLHLMIVLVFATLACGISSGPATSGDAPVGDSNILFQDDFSNTSSGWDRADWDGGLTDYGSDVYRMVVKIPSYNIWANPGQYFEGDVRVEVDATKITGEDDNDFGLLCRYTGTLESPSFYFFIISSDGFAVIGKGTAGVTEYLSSEFMEPSDAINQGSTLNHLRADCIGNSLTFFVNGQQVVSTTDASYTGGDVGVTAGTFDIPNAEIAFDNFIVRKP
ncbi:MAG: hypothetical protein ISR59_11930 [Anaerolineales bacterium]|uniref:3-keto-disaccharide hydrolase domain-containing protein n=1 Tax=Candidatus Desulfolinea nitratireducens TaxID=2841698 RepID=A0A8J6NKY5_9CHLR|nr:hypothetical protein [Candidatus Desulfolinea nitratireducens]MBL6961808.1 hypothetical protein [Anaerolineales bacterium]